MKMPGIDHISFLLFHRHLVIDSGFKRDLIPSGGVIFHQQKTSILTSAQEFDVQ